MYYVENCRKEESARVKASKFQFLKVSNRKKFKIQISFNFDLIYRPELDLEQDGIVQQLILIRIGRKNPQKDEISER